MLTWVLNKLGNTVLFYSDKNGNVVFKNFCIFKSDGNLYSLDLTKQEVGKILEYRFKLNRNLRLLTLLTIILSYFIFIKFNPTITNILLTEFITICIVFFYRFIFGYVYDKKLLSLFGEYKVVNFNPSISKDQSISFRNNVYLSLVITVISLIIFFVPSFILKFAIYECVMMKNPKFETAINISKKYLAIYPKSVKILDLTAYAKYQIQDYNGAVQDYKKIFDLEGKYFDKNDYIRFSNLLYLENKISGFETAIDTFNEYLTKKDIQTLDYIKMLWIKSIFSIENCKYDMITYDYEEFGKSLDDTDKNKFYLKCDRTYMLYLMGEYLHAIDEYDDLIDFALNNDETYRKDLVNLYAERGFAKWRTGDIKGKDTDFMKSGIDLSKINSYEPVYQTLEFISPKMMK